MKSFWTVKLNVQVPSNNPSFPGHTYPATRTHGVVAGTLQEAVARVMTEFPDCEIWAVNHQGKITLD